MLNINGTTLTLCVLQAVSVLPSGLVACSVMSINHFKDHVVAIFFSLCYFFFFL